MLTAPIRLPLNQHDDLGLMAPPAQRGVNPYLNRWKDIKLLTLLLGYNLTWTAMSHADGTIPGDWTLNKSETDKIKTYKTYRQYLSDYLSKELKQDFLGKGGGSASWTSQEQRMDFRTLDYGSDPYYAFGDVRFQAKGAVCAKGSHVHFKGSVNMTDTYTFLGHNYNKVPSWTPTHLGWYLQFIGLLHAFNDSGTFQETVDISR
jgi:hypothetical protein